MPKRVAVAFADSHLAPRAWASRPVDGDAYFSLSYIVDAAIAMNVPLFGAGDLLDKQENRASPVVFFQSQLERLRQHNLKLHYIQGQHELDDIPWLSGHPVAVHQDQRSFKLGPLNCYALDYRSAGNLQAALDAIPAGTDILFAHQVWAENMGEIASPQGAMLDVPVVSSVFTGDYHIKRLVRTSGKDGQPLIMISPGSTCMQSINEPPDKYFFVLYDDGTFKEVRIPTRPFMDWSPLYDVSHLDQFASEIQPAIVRAVAQANTAVAGSPLPGHLQKPLLRVTYATDLSPMIRRVMSAVGDSAFVFFKELPPPSLLEPAAEQLLGDLAEEGEAVVTGEPAAAGVVARRRTATLESLLPGYLQAKITSDLLTDVQQVTADAERLLQSEDVDGELQRIRAESLA